MQVNKIQQIIRPIVVHNIYELLFILQAFEELIREKMGTS